jgi:hypothetical protein
MDELFSLEELNYLATKVSGMKDWQTELFTAALESGRLLREHKRHHQPDRKHQPFRPPACFQ